MATALQSVEVWDPWDIEGTLAHNGAMPPSALAALDNALHDLAAKRLGVPVYRLLGLARPEPVSAYTLGIADRETTVADAQRLRKHRILKVKVGGWSDVETLRAVRESSEADLWVDANEAFSPEEALEVVTELKEIGVGMIEQPVPASAGPEAFGQGDGGGVPRAGDCGRECHRGQGRARRSPGASAGSTSSSPSAAGSGARWR